MTSETVALIGVIIALVNLALTGVGGVIFIVRLEGKLNVQTVRIQAVEISTQTFAAVVTNNAVQDQKILAIEKTIDDLRRGNGFITGPRQGLNGEYNS